MSYWSAGIAQISDVKRFVEATQGWAGAKIREYGATDLTLMQVVFGGEQVGRLFLGVEYPSIDAMLEGKALQETDPQIVRLTTDCGFKLLSQSLLKTVGERGDRAGAFASGLYVAHEPLDEETVRRNLDVNWSHLEEGATGLIQLQLIAAGERTGLSVFLTNTDSADSFFSASARNFADPHTQRVMTDFKAVIVNRFFARRLIG